MLDRVNESVADPEWLAALKTAVIVLDPAPIPRWISPSAEEMFGVSAAHAGERLVPRLESAGVLALVAHARRSGRTLTAVGIEYHDAERSLLIDVDITPLDGEAVLLECHEATLRQRAELERDQRHRRELSRRVLAQLAHEIRNPLAGLKGAAQLLDRDEADPARSELLGILVGEVSRLDRLVEQMLGTTRIATPRAVSIHAVVDRVHALLASEAGERVELVRDYDPSLPECRADADAVVRALLNLGRNALQAGAGRVVLRTRALRNATWDGQRHRLALAVEVVDNGPGVPAELVDSLFFPLVTSKPDGSGLGLAIAQELAKRHSGRIEYQRRDGQTCFRLLLPLPARPGVE